jgi:hypothetical protein
MSSKKHLRKGAISLAILALIGLSIWTAYGFFQPENDTFDYSSNSPYPGNWALHGTDPLGDGPAELFVSASGMIASLFTDGQTVILSRQPYPGLAMYQSSVRPWSVPDGGSGTVWFELNADTREFITGVIHVNYSSTAKDFPFSMDLVDIDLSMIDNPYNIPEGDWDMDLSEGQDDCGENGGRAGISNFTNMESGEMKMEYVYDFDTGSDITNEIHIHSEGNGFFMERTGDNSFSHIGDGFDMGIPMDSTGDMMLDFEAETFTGQFEFNVNAENQMNGFLNVTSSNGCSVNFTVDMSHISPPSVPAIS